jgi:hypothetical protein
VQSYGAQEIADGAKSGRWAPENRKNGAVFADAPGTAPAVAAATVPAVPLEQVRPSDRFRTADFGALRIDRPENWAVTDAQQTSATIAPRAGVSASAVAYGVVIRSGQTPSANMSVSQLTAAIIQNLRSGDSKMKQVGDVEAITVNGTSAGSVELETISPMPDARGNPQMERDWLIAFPRGRANAVFLVFVSPLRNYEELRPTFERMLKSIRF